MARKKCKKLILSACMIAMASGNISAAQEYNETEVVSEAEEGLDRLEQTSASEETSASEQTAVLKETSASEQPSASEQTSAAIDETCPPKMVSPEGYSSVQEEESENVQNIHDPSETSFSDNDSDEYDKSIYDTSFENKTINLPAKETILKDDELMLSLNQEKEEIERITDGEIVDVSHYTELAAVYPGIFSERQIAYAIPMDREPEDVTLSVYKKNGVYYSLITSTDDPDQGITESEFVSRIDHIPSDSSMGDGNSFYLVVSMPFYGTYEEAGFPRTGLKAKYETTFRIARNIMTDGEYDEWIVEDSNQIDPYYGITMATTRYSHGIAPYCQGARVFTGSPETSIVNASEFSYSFTVGLPFSLGFSFGWNGSVGTKIQAGIRTTMHDVIFTNPDGIYQTHEDDSLQFHYDTLTSFIVPKTVSSLFQFQFNQVFFNSTFGNQSGMVKHGDFWRIVTPTSGDSGTYTGDPPLEDDVPSVYYWDGIDYSPVFNPVYYSGKYADLNAAFGNNTDALFHHFINNGMDEGRQASVNFNPAAYKKRYADLQAAFGDQWRQYYLHYLNNGMKEGRIGN